jgi:hypothetical protein
MDAVKSYRVDRVGRDGAREDFDRVTIEDPLEIRMGSQTLAVRMRKPRATISIQPVFGGRSRRARQRSAIVGTSQPRRTPARTRSETAMTNAIPIPRQERRVMRESSQLPEQAR